MKRILFTVLLTAAALTAFPQTYLISSGGTVDACAGDFFDSGGSGGAYGNGENFTMTFNSVHPVNTHIKMSFNNFDVEPGDTLYVHDGSTTAAPVIGAYNNNNLPPAFVKASIYNASGDLTFNFKSNGAVTAPGWFASLVCTPQCQDVIAVMSDTETVPAPNDSNYIDICIGDYITFAADAGPTAFPQNDILYHQDESTTLYEWDFGDGTTATGRVVNHLYTLVRGYDVTLKVTDSLGCYNSNALGLRVRISANPYAQINPLADICSSTDTTYITLGYNASSIITIQPINSQQSASQIFDSTMFIPDGPACPIQCYNTEVVFNAFAPGATITSASDILSICVNMEHSYLGDLGFTIHCPNGQSVILDPNTHGGGAYLGVPLGGAMHDTYDNTSFPCDPAYNGYGTGWTYCWSQIYPQQGTFETLDGLGGTVPPTDTVNNTNYITPENSLNGLIGCPLNGVWNIEICDDFGVDNGYIFWWELNLDPSLLPVGWGYEVPIDTVLWDGSFFSIINDSTIMIIPDSGGTFQYTVTVVDEFGCSYDTTLFLQVVQTPEVDLGNDTILCGNGITYNLDAGPGDYYFWSTSSPNQTIPVTTTGYYSVTVENYNMSSTLTCADADTVYIKVLALPYADLGPDICINEPITLDAGNPTFLFEWTDENGNVIGTDQTLYVNSEGTYTVNIAEEYGYNCESMSDIYVAYFPVPQISIGPDTTICRHHTLEIKVTDQYGYLDDYDYQYYWLPFMETNPYLVVSWLNPQVYEVIVNVTGCPNETVADTMYLTVEPCDLTIPNIITPNGDGLNDEFYIPNVEFYPNSTMTIYNRWGRKVHEDTNYQGQWDGENCADGVYFWVFTVNYGDHGNGLETIQQHGTVTILR